MQVNVTDDRDTLGLQLVLSGPAITSTGPPVVLGDPAPVYDGAYQVGLVLELVWVGWVAKIKHLYMCACALMVG